jgi:hypothetical protein
VPRLLRGHTCPVNTLPSCNTLYVPRAALPSHVWSYKHAVRPHIPRQRGGAEMAGDDPWPMILILYRAGDFGAMKPSAEIAWQPLSEGGLRQASARGDR